MPTRQRTVQINTAAVLSVKRNPDCGSAAVRLKDDRGRDVTINLRPRQFETLARKVLAARREWGSVAAGTNDADRDLVRAELRATAGNVNRTARRLGGPRSTLRYWIETYELEDVVPRD